jgi:hypothetical protein
MIWIKFARGGITPPESKIRGNCFVPGLYFSNIRVGGLLLFDAAVFTSTSLPIDRVEAVSYVVTTED